MPFITKGKTNWKFLLIVVILAIIVGGGILGFQYWWVPRQEAKLSIEENSSGTIEGSLGYPSDFIPIYMKVCAEKIGTKELYCTGAHIKDSKYRYGEGYKINLPPGDYYVFATFQGDKAYYSDFVTCGFKTDCSHNPIKVTVIAGEIIGDVDPQDWYK